MWTLLDFIITKYVFLRGFNFVANLYSSHNSSFLIRFPTFSFCFFYDLFIHVWKDHVGADDMFLFSTFCTH